MVPCQAIKFIPWFDAFQIMNLDMTIITNDTFLLNMVNYLACHIKEKSLGGDKNNFSFFGVVVSHILYFSQFCWVGSLI